MKSRLSHVDNYSLFGIRIILLNFDRKETSIPKPRHMKKILGPVLLCLLLQAGKTFAGNEQTLSNLLAAFQAEATASARYTAFAAQALKEGYPQIAVLFSAAAKSASIHAQNHKTVLTRMGQAIPAIAPKVEAGTTRENLQAAIDGETTQSMKIYPEYMATAKAESVMDAAKSIRWAMETDKKHVVYFQNALQALNGNNLTTLPKFYWVCPKCGNTYNVATTEKTCSFCGTSSSKFIKITK
jgi:rubrerythrin